MKKKLGVYLFAKVLFGLIVVALGLNIFYFFKRDYFFQKRIPVVSEAEKESLLLSEREKSDYEVFLKEIEKKNIFVSPQIESGKPSGVDREKISRIIGNLELVGIIAGDPKRAVIEDKKAKKTFHLKEGESFLEDINLEEIGSGLVILNCHGEIFELYL